MSPAVTQWNLSPLAVTYSCAPREGSNTQAGGTEEGEGRMHNQSTIGSKPRCCAMSLNTQDTFWPMPDLISIMESANLS